VVRRHQLTQKNVLLHYSRVMSSCHICPVKIRMTYVTFQIKTMYQKPNIEIFDGGHNFTEAILQYT